MNTGSLRSKSYLFTTWEGGGNVAPALTLARKLRERGHRVRFMCDVSAESEAVARGVAFRPWKEAPNRRDRTPSSCPVRDWEATDPAEGVGRVMDRIMAGPARAYARDLLEELEREPADLVVTSEMLLGAMAACESRGQRYVILTANLCFYPFPGMPAFGPGLAPPRSASEREVHAQIVAGTKALFDAGLPALNAAREALGLAPLAHVWEQCATAELFLLGTSRAFDFPVAELPSQIRYVGPLLDEPAWAEPWKPRLVDERPLIAVGFSTTYQNHAGVLQKVIDAAAVLPVRVLATLGPIAASDLAAPENAMLVASAPHNEVMAQAKVVVTHGGHGTVTRALARRRPLLILPHGRDQNENAVRVTERGAGLSLSPGASVEEIRACLQRLLEEESFGRSAEALGAAIEAGAGDTPAVPLLESLAGLSVEPAPLAS